MIRFSHIPPGTFLSQAPSFAAPYVFAEPFDGTGNLHGKFPPVGVQVGGTQEPWQNATNTLWTLSNGITTCTVPLNNTFIPFVNPTTAAYTWANTSSFETRVLLPIGARFDLELVSGPVGTGNRFGISLERKFTVGLYDRIYIAGQTTTSGGEKVVDSLSGGPAITWPADGIIIIRFAFILNAIQIYVNEILYNTLTVTGYSTTTTFAAASGNAPYFMFRQNAFDGTVLPVKVDYIVLK